MIFSSSHDHGPALSFFKLPRSGASLIIYSSSHDHGPALSLFFFLFYTATITGQFYHFLKQPRSRVCVIIFFILPRSRASFVISSSSHDHGPALSFFLYPASITGQISHFLMLPRSRASVSSSSSHDHGPAL